MARALALAPGSTDIARATTLMRLGALAEGLGDYASARTAYTEALGLREAVGDEAGADAARNNLANVMYYLGDLEASIALYEQNLEVARSRVDDVALASTLCNLALAYVARDEPLRARPMFEESLELARRLGDPYGVATVAAGLGAVAADTGRMDDATGLLLESLRLHRELDIPSGTAAALEELAGVALASEDAERAGQLLGAAEVIRDTISAKASLPVRNRALRMAERIGAALGKQGLEAALASGRSLSPDAAAALAGEIDVSQ